MVLDDMRTEIIELKAEIEELKEEIKSYEQSETIMNESYVRQKTEIEKLREALGCTNSRRTDQDSYEMVVNMLKIAIKILKDGK